MQLDEIASILGDSEPGEEVRAECYALELLMEIPDASEAQRNLARCFLRMRAREQREASGD